MRAAAPWLNESGEVAEWLKAPRAVHGQPCRRFESFPSPPSRFPAQLRAFSQISSALATFASRGTLLNWIDAAVLRQSPVRRARPVQAAGARLTLRHRRVVALLDGAAPPLNVGHAIGIVDRLRRSLTQEDQPGECQQGAARIVHFNPRFLFCRMRHQGAPALKAIASLHDHSSANRAGTWFQRNSPSCAVLKPPRSV